jgi:hypothetical protein
VNRAQRIVLVIALGVGLLTAALVANLLMLEPYGGWFAYAPNTSITATSDYFVHPTDGELVRQGLVWLAALALWTAASLRLLRTQDHTDG